MTRQERIESFSKGYDKLTASLKEFPKEMRQYKPEPNKWSIHEIIIHMADSEANSFSRARKIICESSSAVMVYDQDLWAVKTNYHEQSIEDALELFKLLRRMTYNVIKDLPEETWHNYIQHPENGKMTLDDWLKVYDEHVQVHINQMKRNFNDWNKSKN